MLTMRNDQFPDGKNSASRPAVSNPPIGPAARPTRPERAPLTLEGAPDNRRRYGPGPVTFHPATGTLCPLRAKPADGRGHQKMSIVAQLYQQTRCVEAVPIRISVRPYLVRGGCGAVTSCRSWTGWISDAAPSWA